MGALYLSYLFDFVFPRILIEDMTVQLAALAGYHIFRLVLWVERPDQRAELDCSSS